MAVPEPSAALYRVLKKEISSWLLKRREEEEGETGKVHTRSGNKHLLVITLKRYPRETIRTKVRVQPKNREKKENKIQFYSCNLSNQHNDRGNDRNTNTPSKISCHRRTRLTTGMLPRRYIRVDTCVSNMVKCERVRQRNQSRLGKKGMIIGHRNEEPNGNTNRQKGAQVMVSLRHT